MNEGQGALWSAPDVRTQAAQCTGQVDIWEACEEVRAAWRNGTCDYNGCTRPLAVVKDGPYVEALCAQHAR